MVDETVGRSLSSKKELSPSTEREREREFLLHAHTITTDYILF